MKKKQEDKNCAGCGQPIDDANVVGKNATIIDGKRYHSAACERLEREARA